MSALDSQLAFWNTAGVTKTYSHPVDLAWLGEPSSETRVVDYGCGYGRLTGLVHDAGWTNVEGVDIAPAVIDQARTRWPHLPFRVLSTPPALPHDDASVDVVVLFAVLTCVPTDAGQRQLVHELHRVLSPGGILYLSDYVLQRDRRNLARYQEHAARYDSYGVFETADGGVFRHHSLQWLRDLLGGFEISATREITVNTMNHHPATAIQIRATKPHANPPTFEGVEPHIP